MSIRIIPNPVGCNSICDRWVCRESGTFQVHDLLSGARFLWQGPRNYVSLDPGAFARAHFPDPPPRPLGEGFRLFPIARSDASVGRMA